MDELISNYVDYLRLTVEKFMASCLYLCIMYYNDVLGEQCVYWMDGVCIKGVADAFEGEEDVWANHVYSYTKREVVSGPCEGLCVTDKSGFVLGHAFKDVISLIGPPHESRFYRILFEGVPGCGKTYNITTMAKADDLILSESKKGAQDARMALLKLGKDVRVKTIDSFLINFEAHGYDKMRFSRVFVDEFWMAHVGKLQMLEHILLRYNCDNNTPILYFGDRKQIPWINRYEGDGYVAMDREKFTFDEIKPYESITRRCPQSMMPILRDIYPGITTVSKEEGNVKVERMVLKQYDSIGVKEGEVLMCFNQAEKEELLSYVSRNGLLNSVHTVHESEGSTFQDVRLVRLLRTKIPIYDQLPHIIVALTRHMGNLTYVTVREDKISRMLAGGAFKPDITLVKKGRACLELGVYPFVYNYEEEVEMHYQLVEEYDYSTTDYIWWSASAGYTYMKTVYADANDWLAENAYDDGDIEAVEIFMQLHKAVVNEEAMRARFKEVMIRDYKDMVINPASVTTIWDDSKVKEPDIKFIFELPYTPVLGSSTEEIIMALYQRNLDPPRSIEPSIYSSAIKLATRLINNVLDERKLLMVQLQVQAEGEQGVISFLMSRTARQLARLKGLIGDPRMFLTKLAGGFLKTETKPSIMVGDHIPQVQVVHDVSAAHNFKFSALNHYLNLVMECCLDRVIFYNHLSMDDLALHITSKLNDMFVEKRIKKIYVDEYDISGADKSYTALLYFCIAEVYRRFGLSALQIKQWLHSTKNRKLLFKAGVRISTHSQLPSGGGDTYRSNSILAMFVLALAGFDFTLLVLGGDDSLRFTTEDYVNISDLASRLLNVNVTNDNFASSIYFCSSFMLYHDFRVVFVPDVIKSLLKLKRPIESRAHAEEVARSIGDRAKPLLIAGIATKVIEAHLDRYQDWKFNAKEISILIGTFVKCCNVNYLLKFYDGSEKALASGKLRKDVYYRKQYFTFTKNEVGSDQAFLDLDSFFMYVEQEDHQQ